MYKIGSPSRHGQGQPSEEWPVFPIFISRLEIRQDGFASLSSDGDGRWALGTLQSTASCSAEFTTVPLLLPQPRDGLTLQLNVYVSDGAELRVEIQTVHGVPLPGRSALSCVLVVGNFLNVTVG